MVAIKIDNSECQITGVDRAQVGKLRNILCYHIDAQMAHFSGAFNTKRYLIDKHGVFPTGLLYLAEKFLKDNKIPVQLKDIRHAPKPQGSIFKASLGLTPYPEQIEAVEACLKHMRGTIKAVTGFGKSVTMAILVSKLQVPTLIVVPNLELKKQLQESFAGFFGKDTVGSFSDKKLIAIDNVDALDPNEKADMYDCVICDEAHHVAAATYRKLNKSAWGSIFHRYFFTATPFRSRSEENILFESIAGKLIYEVSYHTAVKKGYIVPIEAYYVNIPKTQMKGNTTKWASVYSELVVNNKVRNEIIAQLLTNLNNSSTLCLVKEIQHGDLLAEETGLSFMHGQNPNNRMLLLEFLLEERKGLIGTVGVLGEGLDSRPAEYIIIAGLGKSKNQIQQQIGRGVRRHKNKESAKIIIFRDPSHKFTLRHFKEQYKIIVEEYGVTPVELKI